MSSTEHHLNSSQSKADPVIETVYTTVESQPEPTDWLTVVSNLRQINRQLVEQIARLEQALASSKQSVHTYKEEKQTHEITILQQQDELKITHDRVAALFQQLETSHQIGQRQQALIETISQQLEIAQAIIPQLEAENEELCQKYQQQSQRLTKTEQVAVGLHRQLKQQTTVGAQTTPAPNITPNKSDLATPIVTDTFATENPNPQTVTATVEDTPKIDAIQPIPPNLSAIIPTLDTLPENEIGDRADSTPPHSPYIPPVEIPAWTPSTTTPTWKTAPSSSKSSPQINWRDAIASSTNTTTSDTPKNPLPSPTLAPTQPPEILNPESTPEIKDSTTSKPSPNWPAPTLDRQRPAAKKVIIDLPKFPNHQGVRGEQ